MDEMNTLTEYACGDLPPLGTINVICDEASGT